jgi:hypothetical protein
MHHTLRRPSSAVAVLALLALACGSESGSEFDNGGSSGAGNNASGGGGLGSSGGGETTSGGTSGGPACAAQTSNAERTPAHLFFILDQSWSMVQPDPQRWSRVTSAFKAFLNDPLSKGVSGGLAMFPTRNGERCSASSYSNLDVAMTALPGGAGGSAPFETFLNATPSSATASTPTRFVLEGIAPLAKAHALANPDVKTALVLMTDGKPQSCSAGNAISDAAAQASAVKDVVPTYVIGVAASGSEKQDLEDNLVAIAAAGGTGTPFMIEEGADPVATEAKFREAIDSIRGRTLSCDLDIPAPPAGETLDLQKVNVAFTTGSGAKVNLGYDEACTATGWRFDQATAPKKIVLCQSACDTFKADPKGIVGVEFGCERRAVNVK